RPHFVNPEHVSDGAVVHEVPIPIGGIVPAPDHLGRRTAAIRARADTIEAVVALRGLGMRRERDILALVDRILMMTLPRPGRVRAFQGEARPLMQKAACCDVEGLPVSVPA